MVTYRVRIEFRNRFFDSATPPMPDDMMILGGLSHGLNATTLRRLTPNVEPLLSMTGRITMLSISGLIDSGGGYWPPVSG